MKYGITTKKEVNMSEGWTEEENKKFAEEREMYKTIEITGSGKQKLWLDFAVKVNNHILDYVVPQYGDFPDEMIENFSIIDIKKQLDRYVTRIDSGARGIEEAKRDTLKIAHYACYLLTKLNEKEINMSEGWTEEEKDDCTCDKDSEVCEHRADCCKKRKLKNEEENTNDNTQQEEALRVI